MRIQSFAKQHEKEENFEPLIYVNLRESGSWLRSRGGSSWLAVIIKSGAGGFRCFALSGPTDKKSPAREGAGLLEI